MIRNVAGWMCAFVLVAGLPVALTAQESNQTKSDRPYDVLLVRPSGQKQVEVVDPTSGEVVLGKPKQDPSALEGIGWALSKARVTALVDGTFHLPSTLTIPVSNTSLIIGPDATLLVPDASHGHPVVKNVRKDDVNVFHFGKLEVNSEKDQVLTSFVFFDGRNAGKPGIEGGRIFATGTIENVAAGYWLVDTTAMQIPLVWGAGFKNALMPMEGNRHMRIGTVAGLALGDNDENEAIDFNVNDRDIHVDTVIGTAAWEKDEILDMNSTQYVLVDRVIALMGSGKSGSKIFKDPLPQNHSGLYSERTDILKPKGNEVRKVQRIQKEVAQFRRKVTLPEFPDRLPALKVKTKLIVEFKDGSTKTLHNRTYQYDL